uniref:Calponin-homology (CH) domain-containing protein n=1 Tax=Arcella intermedia TaxID=1963864 RepID=A0A6B2KXY9_9EUKA
MVDYINSKLNLNIDPTTEDIFEELKSGVLFCKLIDAIEPSVIAINKLNEDPKNQFEINENLDVAIEAAKRLGCSIINIGPSDICEGRKHIVLGLFWQIVRVGLSKSIASISAQVNTDVSISLPPEQILLMWINNHIKVAGINKVITNFGEDLKDCEVLTRLLHQLEPELCDLSPLNCTDLEERAELFLSLSEKIGCRKFISSEDIVKGNARVNFAFIATVFSKYPRMGNSVLETQLTEENKKLLDDIQTLKNVEQQLVEEKKQWNEETVKMNKLVDELKEDIEKEKAGNLKNLEIIQDMENQRKEVEEKWKQDFESLKVTMETEKTNLENQKKEVEEKWRQDFETMKVTMETEKSNIEALKKQAEEKWQQDFEAMKVTLETEKVNMKLQLEEQFAMEIQQLKEQLLTEKNNEKTELEQKWQSEYNQLQSVLTTEKNVAKENELRLEGEKKTVIEEKLKLEEEKRATDDKLAAALERIKELEAEIDSLKQEIARLKSTIQLLEQTMDSNKIASELLDTEYKVTLDELEKTVAKLKESEHEIKRQEGEIATLHVELGDVKSELLKTVDSLGLLEGQKVAVVKLLENDQKTGFLQKKSPNTKLGIKLQKRFFVLRGGNLYYYKTDKDYNAGNRAHPTGVIPLDNATVILYKDDQSKKETGSQFAFEIKLENEKLFVLVALTDEDRMSWYDLINKVIGVNNARNHTALKTNLKIAESTRTRIQTLTAFQRAVMSGVSQVASDLVDVADKAATRLQEEIEERKDKIVDPEKKPETTENQEETEKGKGQKPAWFARTPTTKKKSDENSDAVTKEDSSAALPVPETVEEEEDGEVKDLPAGNEDKGGEKPKKWKSKTPSRKK